MVKNPPAMQETRVRSLRQADPLEKGYGNPLQNSCLENSMDRGARQATSPYGCEESHTTEQLTLPFSFVFKYILSTKIVGCLSDLITHNFLPDLLSSSSSGSSLVPEHEGVLPFQDFCSFLCLECS